MKSSLYIKNFIVVFFSLILFSCSTFVPLQIIKTDKENNLVYLNQGNDENIKVGQTYEINNISQSLFDPATGKTIILTKGQSGIIKIIRVEKDYSVGVIISQSKENKIKIGNKLSLMSS